MANRQSPETLRRDPDDPGYEWIPPGFGAYDLDYLRRRARNRPHDFQAWFRLAMVLDRRCNAVEAKAAFAMCVRLAPENGLARYMYARTLLGTGDRKEGVRQLTRAAELRTADYHVWDLLGAVHLESRKFGAALEAYQNVVGIRPDGESWYQLGRCLWELTRYREAVVAFEESIRLKPNHLIAHTYLALLGDMVGERELADRHIQILFTLDEDRARDLDVRARG